MGMIFSVAVIAFVMLKEGQKVESEEDIEDGLKELVKNKIASFAVPNMFLVGIIPYHSHAMASYSGVHYMITSFTVPTLSLVVGTVIFIQSMF